MEYLQYRASELVTFGKEYSFKPYYKWNTFNTNNQNLCHKRKLSFKPYYKWNTFNTYKSDDSPLRTLSFKPYYKWNTFNTSSLISETKNNLKSFKPYYKWNTFNTVLDCFAADMDK